MDYYQERTKVTFTPHIGVDMSKFGIQEDNLSSSSEYISPAMSPRVSSPRSPESSPRIWIAKRLSLQTDRPRTSPVSSPRLRKTLFQRSPRSSPNSPRSREVSPRSVEVSPKIQSKN